MSEELAYQKRNLKVLLKEKIVAWRKFLVGFLQLRSRKGFCVMFSYMVFVPRSLVC